MAILWIAGFDLPRYLENRQIRIVDGKGMNYMGRFVSANGDAIVIDQGYHVKVPRASVLSITRYASRHVRGDRFFEAIWEVAFLAPGPLPIVTLPVAIVVSVVGLPVCALLDTIQGRDTRDETIKLLPDKK